MKKIEELTWREFDVKDIFPNILRGRRLKTDDHIMGDMPYISSSAMNNGVDNFVSNKEGVRIFNNCLTIANSGSVGATFYHPYSFVASDHVTSLKNIQFNKYIYLFIATISKGLSEKYSFNREIKDSRLRREKILLPVNNDTEDPDYNFMEEYMKRIEFKLLSRYKKYLETKSEYQNTIFSTPKNWMHITLKKECDVLPGVRLIAADMKTGKRPFIGATESMNGITQFVNNINKSLDKNVLGVNYNGSVGIGFYHPYEALFSDDVKRLHLKNLKGNKYSYLFLATSIKKQSFKFQYGYKMNAERMKEQKIMLPANSEEEPDYEYMENYMRNIEDNLLRKYISKRLKA